MAKPKFSDNKAAITESLDKFVQEKRDDHPELEKIELSRRSFAQYMGVTYWWMYNVGGFGIIANQYDACTYEKNVGLVINVDEYLEERRLKEEEDE